MSAMPQEATRETTAPQSIEGLVQNLLQTADALSRIAHDPHGADLLEAEEGHLLIALSRIQMVAMNCYEKRKAARP